MPLDCARGDTCLSCNICYPERSRNFGIGTTFYFLHTTLGHHFLDTFLRSTHVDLVFYFQQCFEILQLAILRLKVCVSLP